MEFVTTTTALAVAAISLIRPFLGKAGEAFAEKVGEGAWAKAKLMYESLRHKLGADPTTDPAFAKLAASPADPQALAAAASRLDDVLKDDPRFAKDLATLLRDAVEQETLTVFNVNAQHNKNVNVVNKLHGGIHNS
jgi:hypothetical protein